VELPVLHVEPQSLGVLLVHLFLEQLHAQLVTMVITSLVTLVKLALPLDVPPVPITLVLLVQWEHSHLLLQTVSPHAMHAHQTVQIVKIQETIVPFVMPDMTYRTEDVCHFLQPIVLLPQLQVDVLHAYMVFTSRDSTVYSVLTHTVDLSADKIWFTLLLPTPQQTQPQIPQRPLVLLIFLLYSPWF